MLNLENYIFSGTSNNRYSSLLVTLFNLLGIDRNGWALNSTGKCYWIEDKHIEAADDHSPRLLNKQLITIDQLIKLILSQHPELEEKVWWKNLKVGDQVVINFPRSKSYENYPFGHPVLYDFDGKTVTIGRIIGRALSYSSISAKKEDFNGDYSAYLIEECPGYNFHSSMFLAPDTKPVKKLQLSSVSNSILDDIEEDSPELDVNSEDADKMFFEEILRPQPFVRVEPFHFIEPDLPW